LGVQDEYLRSDGAGREFLRATNGGSSHPITAQNIDTNDHFVYQDGKTVFKNAVFNMADAAEKLLERNKLTTTTIQWLAAHQANKRIIDATANRINLTSEKVMTNIEKYGNTTSGTLPLLLSDYESQLKKGDNIVFAAFGGGFNWGSMYLKWAYNSKN
jgi:3-oxoacyl-[acyl-carrier-protein] synthase-3